MSMDWFRHDNGLSTDAKLSFIAKQAGARRCEMTALWNCLLEHASAHEDRGFVGDIDLDVIAYTQEIEIVTVKSLHALLVTKGVVTEGRLKHWERYNSVTKKPAKSSAERVRKHRDEKKKRELEAQQELTLDVTKCNDVTNVTTHYSNSTLKKERNSPLPPPPVDNSEDEFLKNGKVEFEKKNGFHILDHVSPEGLAVAKSNAPRWDVKLIAGKFDENIKTGKMTIPRYPDKAFSGFCAKYTGGKPP